MQPSLRTGRVFPYGIRRRRIGALPMPPAAARRYPRTMPRTLPRLAAAAALLPLAGLLAAGCLAYAPDGSVATPAPQGQSGGSRLPQLLSQLQGAGAGMEVFSETPQNEVLAAQDQEPGKGGYSPTPGASPTATVAGDRTTPTPTPRPGTPTPTPRPASPTPTPAGSEGVTPTPTPTATPTRTPTPTPTPTSTPTPTPTPRPPTEGGSNGTPTPPPTEG